ncbi:ester cyclase, partial [Flavobacteriaceae bacterium]|nr:ester cyclase [Flavobacteriaceae bacterium]
MKKLLFLVSLFLIASCSQQPSQECQALETANTQIQKDIKMYKAVWNQVFIDRDINLIDSESFDDQATVVTATGNITGLDSFRDYYNNFLTGFSDAEFTFIDIFGQGDNIVKHWNLKGTHDGEMFGIPAT